MQYLFCCHTMSNILMFNPPCDSKLPLPQASECQKADFCRSSVSFLAQNMPNILCARIHAEGFPSSAARILHLQCRININNLYLYFGLGVLLCPEPLKSGVDSLNLGWSGVGFCNSFNFLLHVKPFQHRLCLFCDFFPSKSGADEMIQYAPDMVSRLFIKL